MNGYVTIGQIARLVGCAPRTVSKWFDAGILRGYRLPSERGAGERRVTCAEFDRFCREYEIRVELPYGATGDSLLEPEYTI